MTKRTPNMEMKEQILEVMADVNNVYGDSLSLMEGTSGLWPEDKIIRSGSIQLDLAIGVGGWPKGRIAQIYGPESCGKTTLALHAVREAQAQGILSVYIDSENALDPNYMRKLGIDLDMLLVSQPTSLESSIDLMNFLMENQKAGLVVLDSIASLKSNEVVDNGAEKMTRASEARIWSSQLPKLSRNARLSNTMLIMINQPRDSMDMYKPEALPGGRALGFYSSLKVRVKKIQEGKKNEGMEGLDYQEGQFTLEKNKVASPYKKGSFFIVPGNPIDWEEDVILAALGREVITNNRFYDRKECDGSYVVKKGWHALLLTEADVELAAIDDPEFEYMAFNEPVDGHIGVYQVYNFNPFFAGISKLTNLLEALEMRVLNTLNEGTSFIDSETTKTEEDVTLDNDEVVDGGEAAQDWGGDD